MPEPLLDIVTRGWDLPGWAGSFYPPDLPSEWRLSYFANEFPAVLVPAGSWVRATAEQLGEWAEDAPTDFRFYLELPPRERDMGALPRAVSALGARLSGWVGDAPAHEGTSTPFFRWRDKPSPDDVEASATARTFTRRPK